MRLAPVLALAACATVHAPPPAAPAPPATFATAAVDTWLAARAAGPDVVGLSVAIVRGGEVVLLRGYGKRSLTGGGAPVTPETRFAIGSVSKQLTAACVLLLQEDGKLSVQDPVAKYLPGLAGAGNVTLYDLLTQASGYPDYYPLDYVDRRMLAPTTSDEILRRYATGPLDFAPGTHWSYSNTNYVALGRVVEKVSGEPFDRFLGRRILEPLGMSHTSFGPGGAADVATGYTSFELGPLEEAPVEGAGWLFAAGELYSTAADLAAWNLGLAEGRVLRPASLALLATARTLTDGRVTDYGCGVKVKRLHDERVLAHGGAVSGFTAASYVAPHARTAVVVLANTDGVDVSALADALIALALGERPDLPRVAGPPADVAGLALVHQLQAGTLDRSQLGPDLDAYLDEARVRANAARLRALGEPTVVVGAVSERGGMEVTLLRVRFPGLSARALMYRTPDGKIQEFMLLR